MIFTLKQSLLYIIILEKYFFCFFLNLRNELRMILLTDEVEE